MADILMCYPTPSTTSPQNNPALSIFFPGAALESAGYEVAYWDGRFDSQEILESLMDRVKYVGVTSMTGEQLRGAKQCMQLAKAKKKTTIFGGIHPSLLPEECVRECYVDYVVIGEGEKTIVELIGALEKNSGPGPGVVSKEGSTYPGTLLKGEEIPSPITDKTLPYFMRALPRDVMLPTGRGCPYSCGFCYNIAFHKRTHREIPLEKWEQQLDKLPAIEWLQMGEDWVGSKRRVMQLADSLHARSIGWMPSLRADNLDEELVDKLAASGCTGVSIGIESGNPRVLKEVVNKMETKEQFIASAKLLAKYNMRPQYYFIIGFPTETKIERNETFDLADELHRIHDGNMTGVFYSFTPLPGTPLFQPSKDAGFAVPSSLDQWGSYSLNQSFSEEFGNIYFIAGLTFHRNPGDKTDKNFPGLKRLFIKPFELLCRLRWKLRFWSFFKLEKACISALVKWGSRNAARNKA